MGWWVDLTRSYKNLQEVRRVDKKNKIKFGSSVKIDRGRHLGKHWETVFRNVYHLLVIHEQSNYSYYLCRKFYMIFIRKFV